MSERIELFKVKFSKLEETSITLKAFSQHKTIFKTDPFFQYILTEFCLDEKGYLSLYRLDKTLLLSLMNKKDLEVYFYLNKDEEISETVCIKGTYPTALIEYLKSNWNKLESVKFSPDISFESGEYKFQCGIYSDNITVFKCFAEGFSRNMVKAINLPIISEMSNITKDRLSDDYMYSRMSDYQFTIYDLFKFKSYLKNFTDIVYSICKSLNIDDIQEVKGDFRNIIINQPISFLYSNFKTTNPLDIFGFFEYYYNGAYKSHRSNYEKFINIGDKI
jgi:hypothetical protein